MTQDLARLTVQELLAPFRVPIAPGNEEATFNSHLGEVERRLAAPDEAPDVLPQAIIDRVLQLFGPGRRTFEAIEKRCFFALKVWDGKYGPLLPEQHEYAVGVLLWALDPAKLGSLEPGHRRASAYTRLDLCVNHETTHAGFKNRQGELVDVSDALKHLAA